MSQTVRLRNGARMHASLVEATMQTLEELQELNPMAFYQLALVCRGELAVVRGQARQLLQRFSLVDEDGRPVQAARDVVQAAVTLHGDDLVLREPVDDSEILWEEGADDEE